MDPYAYNYFPNDLFALKPLTGPRDNIKTRHILIIGKLRQEGNSPLIPKTEVSMQAIANFKSQI